MADKQRRERDRTKEQPDQQRQQKQTRQQEAQQPVQPTAQQMPQPMQQAQPQGMMQGIRPPMGQMMGMGGTAQTAAQDNASAPTPPQMTAPMASQRIGKEQIIKAMHTLNKYKAGKSHLERRIIESQQWWKLHNWEQMQARGLHGSHDTKSNTAWLWNCIVGKHADFIDSYPEPLVLPRMLDDKEEAKRLSEIVPVVMELNGFEQTYNDAGWQKMLEGTAVYGCFWDKDKLNGLGDISIRKINVLNLYWEPGISDIQDSKNVFSVATMDNGTLEQMYPQLRGKLKKTNTSVAKYRYDDNVDTTDKSLVVDWYYHRYDGGKKTLHYVKFCGEDVLFATENEPEYQERGLYDDSEFPFVFDSLFPVEGSPCGYGYVEIAKDTQKDIDLISQALVSNSVMASTPRYFMRKDGGVNVEEFADWTKPIVTCNGNLGSDTLQPVTVTAIPTNAVEMLTQKIEEIKFITGNSDVQNGSAPSGVTSGVAIAALREDAGRSSKDSNKASYRAYRRLVTMVIERIRQFYDLPRTFRILGDRGEESFVSYTNDAIQPQHQGYVQDMDLGYRLPAFDIEVRAQRENAYTKMAQNDLGIQLYQLGLFNPQMADQALMLLDMMDFKGKEELQQKIQQQAGLMQMLQTTMQLAMGLAQQYDPAIAQQLSVLAQNMGMSIGGAMPTGGATGGVSGVQVDSTTEAGKVESKSPAMAQKEQEYNDAVRPDA